MRRRGVLAIAFCVLVAGFGLWVLWPSAPAEQARVQKTHKKPRQLAIPMPDAPSDAPVEPPQRAVRPFGFRRNPEVGTVLVPDEGRETGFVNVHLVTPDGDPANGVLQWRDCPVTAKSAKQAEIIAGEDCTVAAVRRDGLFTARDQVTVRVEPGESVDVDLVLSSERTGGLGIQIAAADGGFLVESVYPGTPAESLGLEAGDLIVAVDGGSTDALTVPDFIARVTGPEGSAVHLRVAHGEDGAEAEYDVTRAFVRKDGEQVVVEPPVR